MGLQTLEGPPYLRCLSCLGLDQQAPGQVSFLQPAYLLSTALGPSPSCPYAQPGSLCIDEGEGGGRATGKVLGLPRLTLHGTSPTPS